MEYAKVSLPSALSANYVVDLAEDTDGTSMQIIRCSHRLLDVIHEVQMGNYTVFKTSALITVDAGQNPIYVEPFID